MAEINKIIKDEKLEELKRKYKECKEKKKEFMRTHDYQGHYLNKEAPEKYFESGQLDEYFTNWDEFNRLSKEYEDSRHELSFYNAFLEFSPIKSVIDSLKEEIGFVATEDRFAYEFNNEGDMFFLAFDFHHYTTDRSLYEYCTLSGCITYDSDGHIYFFEKEKSEKSGCSTAKETGIYGIHFYEQKFFDKDYMYIYNDYTNTRLFKLVNGKYELIHTFEPCHITTTPELWKKKLLIIGNSKVYNVEENRFIDINSKGVLKTGYSFGNLVTDSHYRKDINQELDVEQQSVMSKYLIDNNLLLSEYSFDVDYKNYGRSCKCICFVDLDGHISSKLYLIFDNDLSCIEFDVTDETYDEVLAAAKEYSLRELKKYVERKLAFERSEANRKKEITLLNQKKLLERMRLIPSDAGVDPKTITLHPKEEK